MLKSLSGARWRMVLQPSYSRRSVICQEGAWRHKPRHLLAGLAAALLAFVQPAVASEQLDAIHKSSVLRIAVYNDFPPYSEKAKGIDVDISQALAEKMGLRADVIDFFAGDEMNDDLRNMVWKGHYLRGAPADVMMHVPIDQVLGNDQVRIFGPYHYETVAMARVASRVPPPVGSAAISLEVFTREKIGAIGDTGADQFLLSVLRGRLRDSVVHYKTVAAAVEGMRKDEVSAVLATRGELEGALKGDTHFALDDAKFGELTQRGWPLGMAVKVDAEDIADALTKALDALKLDGTLDAIFAKYGVTQRMK